jgi:hypothetical protein
MNTSGNVRREEVRAMKIQGKTYAQIGIAYGISRQRAQQLLHDSATTDEHRCFDCGATGIKLDAHHENYETKETILLCVSCHKKRHSPYSSDIKIERKPMEKHPKTVPTKIAPSDLLRLKARAVRNHRNCVQELAAMLDKLEMLEAALAPTLELTGHGDEIGAAMKKAQA